MIKNRKNLTNWKNNFKRSRNTETKVSVKKLDLIGMEIFFLNQINPLKLKRRLKLMLWERLKKNSDLIKQSLFKKKNSSKSGSNREIIWALRDQRKMTKKKKMMKKINKNLINKHWKKKIWQLKKLLI